MSSNQVFLQIVDLFHFLEQFLLSIVFALLPLLAQELAVGDSFAEGKGVDEGVFEYAGVGAHA